jgi:hypothetical protein
MAFRKSGPEAEWINLARNKVEYVARINIKREEFNGRLSEC